MAQQRKTHEEQEFDACFDERGQLRDGIRHLKVPVRMIDSAGGPPQDEGKSIRDAAIEYARARLMDRKPGFTPTASLRTAWYNSLYDERDRELSEQWRRPNERAT